MYFPQAIRIFGILTFFPFRAQASYTRVVRHGDSYAIINEEFKTYLTATAHTYRAEYGVSVGKVLTASEWSGGANQIWDIIKFDGTKNNLFWVFAKFASLNEVTALTNETSSIPLKNTIEFIPTLTRTNETAFLIKSRILDKCVTSLGLDRLMTYEPCNSEFPSQRWFLERIYEDDAEDDEVPEKLRAKVKFGCKFYGK